MKKKQKQHKQLFFSCTYMYGTNILLTKYIDLYIPFFLPAAPLESFYYFLRSVKSYEVHKNKINGTRFREKKKKNPSKMDYRKFFIFFTYFWCNHTCHLHENSIFCPYLGCNTCLLSLNTLFYMKNIKTIKKTKQKIQNPKFGWILFYDI